MQTVEKKCCGIVTRIDRRALSTTAADALIALLRTAGSRIISDQNVTFIEVDSAPTTSLP
jgi:hypothetical protein